MDDRPAAEAPASGEAEGTTGRAGDVRSSTPLTMTRERMRQIQGAKPAVMFGRVSRPKAEKRALAMGRVEIAQNGAFEPSTDWWPALAILTREEKVRVRAKLAAEVAQMRRGAK